MKRESKIFAIYFAVVFIVWISVLVYSNSMIGNYIILDTITKKFEFSKTSQVKKEALFDAMTTPEIFPKVLPNNVLSVKIINHTENEIIAEEEIQRPGIKTKILVKHLIVPYEMHKIESLGETQMEQIL